MHRPMIFASVALALALAGVALAQDATQPAPAPATPQPIERYTGQLVVTRKDGSKANLRVTIRDWIVPNFSVQERFPQDGAMFCQLRAGELMTLIGNERKPRREDESWFVPAGTGMGVRTERDTALLHTVMVAPVTIIK
jgi:hypothetical protein